MGKFVIYAVTMMLISILIKRLDKKGERSPEDSMCHYVVRLPSMLKRVYLALFAMGVILFFVFLFFWLKGNPSITNGNFVLALVICAIGLAVMAYASRWHIVVDNDRFKVYRLFGKTEMFSFAEIDRAVGGSKGQIEVYSGGRKVVTVGLLSENYDWFCDSLRGYGKLVQPERLLHNA